MKHFDYKKIFVDLTAILLIIAISTCIAYIANNNTIIIIQSIAGINLYFGIKYLSRRYFKIADNKKSLFNIVLSDEPWERRNIYLVESSLVASLYITIINIFKILELDIFIINIYLFNNKSINDLVISGISYILLIILTFIIELCFGEYLMKKNDE